MDTLPWPISSKWIYIGIKYVPKQFVSPIRFLVYWLFSFLQDEVEGIIYKAIRERTIEETVTDIKSTWDSMSFVVHKYFNDHRQAEAANEEFGPNNKANNCDANITVDSGGVGVPVDDDKAGGLEVVNVDEDADCQRGCSDSQRYSKEMGFIFHNS